MTSVELKQLVRDHWDREVCGSRYGTCLEQGRSKFFEEIDRERDKLEPQAARFARFEEARGKKVLEVGLGTGSDFVRWVRAGAIAYGRDLTEASVKMVKERLELAGLDADVAIGDAEDLREFPDDFFDIYYSWGVLHHTPDPATALAEAYRVLKPGGTLKIMLYHYPSVSAFLNWILYGPLRLNFIGLRVCYANHVESPGTKALTRKQARRLVRSFFRSHPVEIHTYLGAGDLLSHKLSQKYQGKKWEIAKRLYPRWAVKHVIGHRFGTVMTIRTLK